MGTLQALALLACTSVSDVTLLEFTAEWCSACQTMKPAIRRLHAEGYPVRTVNIDQSPKLKKQFRVTSIPAYVLLVNGREVRRLGPTSFQQLVQAFRLAGYQGGQAPIVRGQSPEQNIAERSRLQELLDGGLGGPTGPVAARPGPEAESRISEPGPGVPGRTGPGKPPAGSRLDREMPRGAATAAGGRQRAMAATVRLRVEDPRGHSFGTGTIIDVHGDEALVITCGHIFRESNGKGTITVSLLRSGRTVTGRLLEYDDKYRDVALVSIRPGESVVKAPVAGQTPRLAMGDMVFSIGCDHGKAASRIESRIAGLNRYQGAPNIEVNGQPVDGRSGGGLFNDRGELIGICNAADPQDNQGIYAALATVHWQLDRVGQRRIYQPEAVVDTGSTGTGQLVDLGPLNGRGTDSGDAAGAAGGSVQAVVQDRDKLICIFGEGKDRRVVVLDRPSENLIRQLMRESERSTDVIRGQSQ